MMLRNIWKRTKLNIIHHDANYRYGRCRSETLVIMFADGMILIAEIKIKFHDVNHLLATLMK
jgi:divalent metal cation (Fe/Co/Zn/Cd) transporter